MKNLFILMAAIIMTNGEYILYDFNTVETSGTWYLVNDDVMGGISKSELELNANGTATFSGLLSLENNGGFASVRSRIDTRLDNNFNGIIIRVMGDGNYYNIRFRTNNNFDGYAYQAKIKTDKKKWTEHKIPFNEFKPTFRGIILNNKPKLESKDIAQIGLLIADKQFGEFSVDIDWIKLYD